MVIHRVVNYYNEKFYYEFTRDYPYFLNKDDIISFPYTKNDMTCSIRLHVVCNEYRILDEVVLIRVMDYND